PPSHMIALILTTDPIQFAVPLQVGRLCLSFFSSRGRHTRFSRDWSSDVCSSDLNHFSGIGERNSPPSPFPPRRNGSGGGPRSPRSEERRVGKECRYRGSPYR